MCAYGGHGGCYWVGIMTTRYLIERIGSKYRATCAELGVWAFGPTVEHAVSALRRRIANLRQRGTSC